MHQVTSSSRSVDDVPPTGSGQAPLQVVSLNLQAGTGADGRPGDVGLLARAVAGLPADVIALQEVDREQPRSGGADQAHIVAEAMGLAHHRFLPVLVGDVRRRRLPPAAEPGSGAAYGLAVASRYPIHRVRSLRLPRLPFAVPGPGGCGRADCDCAPAWHLQRDEPRAALLVTVGTPNGPLHVCCTHLSTLAPVAIHQLTVLLRALRAVPGPLVVCGDLNLRATTVQALARGFTSATALTFPADAPDRQIDHVLLRGTEATGPARSARLAVSDHRAIAVPLTLGGTGGTDRVRLDPRA